MNLRTSAALGTLLALTLVACSGGDTTTGWNPDPAATSGDDSGTPTPGSDAGTPTPTKDSGTTPPVADAAPPTPDAGTPNDGFDAFQHHNLDVINAYRAKLSVAPLTLDAPLSTFALAGSVESTKDHIAHQHFITAGNNGTLWTSGFKSSAGENQGDPNGWYVMDSDPTKNEMKQIDQIQLQMYNEGPGTGEAHGHYMNMMNSKFNRVGIGLVEVSGSLYLTNDFSD